MGASYERKRRANANKLDIAGRWTPIPHTVVRSKEYRGLSHTARSLLFDIAIQYNGNNNGKLVACSKYLKPFGWRSNDSIYRSLKQLTNSGILIQTRQGMRPPCSQAAWFALGWLGLDATDGLDITPSLYRRCQLTPIENIAKPPNGMAKRSFTPTNGLASPSTRPSHGAVSDKSDQLTTPPHGEYIYSPSKLGQIQTNFTESIH